MPCIIDPKQTIDVWETHQNKEIETLKQVVEQKEKEIANNSANITKKLEEINNLNDKIKVLEITVSESKSSQYIIDEIRSIMQQKGFLSDKEFEDLIK